jgi:hypothetical protein
MYARICIGCGEPFSDEDRTRSENPNLCVSCLHLPSEMEEFDNPELAFLSADLPALDEKPAEFRKAA